jgi:hypothetical protein
LPLRSRDLVKQKRRTAKWDRCRHSDTTSPKSTEDLQVSLSPDRL